MEIQEENIHRMREALRGVDDPRRQWGYIRHKLLDMLVIGLCSIMVRGEYFDEMEELGKTWEQWFRKFLELPNGIPDEDTFRRVFERVEPAQLLECLQQWLAETSQAGGREINIDGKTIRGSAKAGEQKGIHMVSAWVNENNLTLGQLATEAHSNEITAIPLLLDTIDIKGDTVTIDAMGCQTEIAAKIRSKQADYVLAVKENQPVLHGEIKEYFTFLDEKECAKEMPEDIWENGLEKDHGRIEKRRVRTACDIDFLTGKKQWKDIKTIIEYRCERTVGGETATTYKYYISSKDACADEFGRIIRNHWSIENNLHWALDVSFGEDGCRARKDNSPKNLTVLRKIALGRLRAIDAGKRVSIKRKMFRASLNLDFLQKVLFGE
jgi:predicted transposase YbfD/YdcC